MLLSICWARSIINQKPDYDLWPEYMPDPATDCPPPPIPTPPEPLSSLVVTTTVTQPDPTPKPYIPLLITLIATLLAVCYMIYAFYFKPPNDNPVVDNKPETTPCQQEQENFLPQQQIQQHVQQ